MTVLLSVVTKVLVVAGIIFGAILGILLIVLGLVLFVPIRYKAAGKYKKDTDFVLNARGGWLLNLLSVKYDYSKDPTKLHIFLFGIEILKKSSVTKRDESIRTDAEDNECHAKTSATVKNDMTDAKVEKKESLDDNSEKLCDYEKNISKEKEFSASDSINKQEKNDRLSDDANKAEGYSKSKKKRRKQSEKKDKKSTKSLKDKLKAYADVVKSRDFKEAFGKCGSSLGRILKTVLPLKWEVKGILDFEDPYTTGEAMAVLGMLYPVFHEHVHIIGRFETPDIMIDMNMKGKVRVFTVLVAALRIYFDKQIRKVLKMFKDAGGC